ncbi:MAG: hypothetical protein CM15mP74_06390 [Halieaceae bacterium]|nr:MAG: hypothetical protein CM15mP74_06390 [Halieaceae bacterium]
MVPEMLVLMILTVMALRPTKKTIAPLYLMLIRPTQISTMLATLATATMTMMAWWTPSTTVLYTKYEPARYRWRRCR